MSEPHVQKSLEKNKEYLRRRFSSNEDLVMRELTIGKRRPVLSGLLTSLTRWKRPNLYCRHY